MKMLLALSIIMSLSALCAQELEDKVDAYLAPLVSSNDFYGTVLFADIEHDVRNTAHSVYHIASVNKPLTAIGVLLLHQREVIDIAVPLEQYLPGYPNADKLTAKHLLSQTSGIPSYNSFPDYTEYAQRANTLEQVVDWFQDVPLSFSPGEKYDYSNSNFVLLAYLIEKVSGQTYEEFMYHNILEPLGMHSTAMYTFDEIVINRAIGYEPANNPWDLKPIGAYNNSIKVGSGAYFSTVGDLFKLDQALYTNTLLNEDTRTLMFTGIKDHEYGLGWGIWKRFDKAKHDHDGTSPGSVAYLSRYPDDRVTIIFLGNINSGAFHRMKYDLAAIYFGKEYEMPTSREYITLPPQQLTRFEGRYQFENGNFFDLRVVDDALRFLWRGRGETGYLLSPLAENSFYMRARGDQIDFEEEKVFYIERSGRSELQRVNN